MTPAEIGKALWEARNAGTVVDVAPGGAITDEAGAYEVQIAQRAAIDTPQVGWKLGATNRKTLDLLGLERPFVGPLHARFCHPNGVHLPLHMAHGPGLETEFLVRLSGDLPHRATPYSADEVREVTDYVCPAFEVVGCRFACGFGGAKVMLLADAGANGFVVEGERGDDWRGLDLGEQALTVTRNGEDIASGQGRLLMWGDPLAAVGWLATHFLVADTGLRAGEVVMTGTCGGLHPLAQGDVASADFGALGRVSATFG